MKVPESIEILGAAAGFCTTSAFVPQIVKIHKQGGRDLPNACLLPDRRAAVAGLRRLSAFSIGDSHQRRHVFADRRGHFSEGFEATPAIQHFADAGATRPTRLIRTSSPNRLDNPLLQD